MQAPGRPWKMLLLLASLLALAACGDEPEPIPAGEPPPPFVPETDATLRPEVPQAILDALSEPDPFARAAALATLLPTLGASEAAAVPTVLEDRALDLGSTERELLTRFWAAYDARAAARWALVMSPPAYRGASILPAVELLARKDPRTAVELMQRTRAFMGPGGEVAQIALVRGWLDGGQPGLEQYLRDLGPSIERQRAIAHVALRLIKRDGPESAIRWAESLSEDDPKFKLDAYRHTASQLAEVAPETAVAFCEKHCRGPFGDAVPNMIAYRWALKDGPAAMAWIAGQPADGVRKQAVKAATRIWAGRDVDAFRAWANEMRGDGDVPEWFHPAIEIYVARLATIAPLEAVDWALQIPYEKARRRTLINALRIWRERDEEAAETWLAASDLDEEALDRVRNPEKYKGRPALMNDEALSESSGTSDDAEASESAELPQGAEPPQS